MLEQAIAETKDRHSKQAISQEAYQRWRASKVTKRLFEDLELAVIDQLQDPLSNNPPDQIPLLAGHRDGFAMMADLVIDWSPAGVEGPNDED